MTIEINEETAKTLFCFIGKLSPNAVCELAQEYKISETKLEKALDELYTALDEAVGKEKRMPLNQGAAK